MRLLFILAGALAMTSSMYAEKVCQSCILRQQSHKDDLKNGAYYEDTGFFTLDTLEGTPLEQKKKADDSKTSDKTAPSVKTPVTNQKSKPSR